ncbi:MAG: DUF554 domain-containing protein [Brevinematales bacterium]|nr:DUF554 domain-containing protein [Brevinematales bacterium]
MLIGTIANVVTVIVGSSIGILFKKSIPERITKIIFDGLGLCTIAISIGMILKAENMIVIVFSILLGALTGEILKVQEFFDSLASKLKKLIKSKDENFTEGFVGAFLIFCIGAMTITGCFDEGVRGNSTILLTKAILDGFCSIALASTLGSGVLFSSIPLFIFQAALTLLSKWIEPMLSSVIINQIIATGGILVLAIGVNLLNIKKIKVSTLLPSIIYVIILSIFVK